MQGSEIREWLPIDADLLTEKRDETAGKTDPGLEGEFGMAVALN